MHSFSYVCLLLAVAGIVNSTVVAKRNVDAEELDTEELDTEELDAEELDAEELDAEELDAEELNKEENNQPGYDEIRKAVCHLKSPNENLNITGKVFISQNSPTEDVTITGNITVITQEDRSGWYGFHIHQFSVPNGICTEAGSHYNPFVKDHGGPGDEIRHVGDLGNIELKCNSKYGIQTCTSNFQMTDSQVTLYGEYSVGGRSIVIHEGKDDLGKGVVDDSKTTGNAGARIACCNINMIDPEKKDASS